MIKLKPETEQALARARGDLAAYCKAMWPPFECAPHHRAIIDRLQALALGSIDRLMIFLPPRHGKSVITSTLFPAWFLGRNPGASVISASYGAELSLDFGRRVRGFVDHDLHRTIFPDCRPLDDNLAAHRFGLTKGGTYFGVGVGGPITGRGADCLPAGTMIETEKGPIAVEKLCQLLSPPRVLSFNHGTNGTEYRRIVAVRRTEAAEFIDLKTSRGRRLQCTPRHRICDAQSSYRQAAMVTEGAQIKISGMRGMWQGRSVRDILSGLLQQNAQDYGHTPMRAMRGKFRATTWGIRESFAQRIYRFLLWTGVQYRTSRNQESPQMRTVWRALSKENNALLFKELQNTAQKVAGSVLSLLRQTFSSLIFTPSLLLEVLSESGTFTSNDGARQFSFQNWNELRGMVQTNETTHFRARPSRLRSLWNRRDSVLGDVARQTASTNQSRRPPYQRESAQQYSGEPDFNLQNLSCDSPQIELDTISSIRRICTDRIPVYDLQVEGNSNFFANQILVHNCLIIDDPIKSAEEAYSNVSRTSLKQWYEQVAYTRLQPGGRIVLIQTRWNMDDLAGWLLREHANDNWIVLSLPALAEPNDVLYRPEGAPLWPSHFSSEELSRIRMAIGSNAWSALYQQRPVAAEGAVFRRDWFHPYVDIPEVYRIIFSLDTAFKTHESSDYSVLEVWGENKTGYYLLDVVRERLDFPALQARAIAKAQFWHPHAVLIEDAASGQSLVQILKVESRLPILPVKPLGDKTARASAVSPLFESGRIFVPQQAHWLADYLDEMTTFPASAHDDQVDATSQALAWLHEHAQISYTGYQSVNGPLGPGEAAIRGERAREWEEDNPGAGGTWNVIAGNARRDFGKGTW